MLRGFLSHKELLDKIVEPMNKSVQEAKLNGYKIDADQRGDIKTRAELKQKLGIIKQLFEKVERQYLGSELYELKEKQSVLKKRQQDLVKAKRFQSLSTTTTA